MSYDVERLIGIINLVPVPSLEGIENQFERLPTLRDRGQDSIWNRVYALCRGVPGIVTRAAFLPHCRYN